MKQIPMWHLASPLRHQRGYSLIELSVAVVIALFLLGGLFSILQSTRKTSANQTLLAQLQDNERIAMTLLTETIQTAGYYPSPLSTNAAAAFPAAGAFAATQSIIGTLGPDSAYPDGIGDSITVRYWPDVTAGAVLGCLGTSDAPGQAHTYELFIKYDDATHKTSSLYCKSDTAANPVALVPNISNMSIYYGVDSTGVGTGVNTYIPGNNAGATNMTAANWLSVYTVSITLSFPNPLAGQPGQSNNPISFTRVIDLMARTGSNSASFD